MIKITRGQFAKILENTTEDKVRIKYVSDVRMNKKGNPFYFLGELAHEVKKETESVYGLGGNYAEMVRDAARASGVEDSSFVAAGKDWIKTIVKDKLYINTNNETIYLRVRILDDQIPVVQYTVDGKPADQDQLETIHQFEKGSASSVKKQSDYGVAEDKQVRVISLAIDKIQYIEIGDQVFVID